MSLDKSEKTLAKDPVCGMSVDPATARHRFEHDETTYYFCCDGCRTKFAADPGRYLAAEPAPHAHHHHHAEPAAPGVGLAVKDPVCGMSVDPATAKHKADHAGATYSFCSGSCRDKFVANPAKYLAPQPAKPADAARGVMYTCPMHPQIRQLGPGSCPICGMALEPEVPTAETGPNPELIDMKRRFWIGLALAVPVFVLEMAGHLTNLHMLIPDRVSNWIQFALATPVVLWAGWPFFERGWASVRTRNLNMFTLIAMGTGVAWVYSVIATFAPGAFPPAFRAADGSVPVYFEAAAVITVLVLLGQVLELRAREQTGGAIRALLDLAPKTARRLRADGTDEDVPLEQVEVGDRLRVRPGDKVPIDGEIVEGKSAVDEFHGHRRIDAGRQDRRRAGHRRNREPERKLCHARRPDRARDGPGPDRPDGGRGPAKRGADPAPRRSGVGLVRADRHRGRRARLRRLGDVRSRAALHLRPDRRRVGADHRLPMRPGARHAHVDHGRRRSRRAGRRADQERRGA